MIAVDTNILIYAYHQESKLHIKARQRLTELGEGETPWAIPLFCVSEFARLVTHPGLFRKPSSVLAAKAFLFELQRSASLEILRPGRHFLRLFWECMEEGHMAGNLVFDAQIAALLREHGIRIILSEDRDFRRFAFLEAQSLV